MKFEKTAEAMLSEDCKERFRAEFWQLHHRASRLEGMLADYDNGELGFEPACPIEVLRVQLSVMTAYLDILRCRAETEKVKLYV